MRLPALADCLQARDAAPDQGAEPRYACAGCPKQFPSAHQLRLHARTHGADWEASRKRQHDAHAAQSAAFRAAYEANPRHCKQCAHPFSFEEVRGRSGKQFCNQSCSARFNNAQRGEHTAQTRERIQKSVRATVYKKLASKPARAPSAEYEGCYSRMERRNRKRLNPDFEIAGPYSRLIRSLCKHCGRLEMRRAASQYCDVHKALYHETARQGYAFSFNPWQHPDIFDAETLAWCEKVGAYAPREGRVDGWSRDHKVSVNEAIRKGHDPFYIRHPLNCELMLFSENSRKKGQSSMSYADLVAAVDAYETQRRTTDAVPA